MKVLLAFGLCLVFCCQALGQGNPSDARVVVDEKIHELLEKIEALKVKAGIDEKQKIQAVEDVLGDVVDFKRITRRVMAKYYKKSSKEQKQAFYKVFKASLLKTYAKGLWEFEDYKIRLKPLKSAHQGQRNTLVEFEVITSSGQVFPVTQSLFYHKKHKRWMVQNVIISGVNIGQLFRDQFARLVSEKSGDLDLAIQAWASAIQAGKPASKTEKSNS
jgi:phospholipid transport system substrate-binding protein